MNCKVQLKIFVSTDLELLLVLVLPLPIVGLLPCYLQILDMVQKVLQDSF